VEGSVATGMYRLTPVFWVVATAVIIGPMVGFRVWEDRTLGETTQIVASWAIVSLLGIIVGVIAFRRACAADGRPSASRRGESACWACVRGFLLGIPVGYVAMAIGSSSTRSDAIAYIWPAVLLIYAAVSAVIASIFGAGLGQRSRPTDN